MIILDSYHFIYNISMNNIFSSKTTYIEFFIKIWKKCPTNCKNCNYANSKLDFFSLENILSRIKYWKELFLDKDFVYFLYWIDFLEHPNSIEILDYIKSTWRKFKIQIGFFELHNKSHLLEKFYEKYWFFEVTLANEVNTKEDIKNVLIAISIFSKLTYLRFNFDIITDFAENSKFIMDLKKIFKKWNIDIIHKNLTFDDVWNINLGITQKFNINSLNKNIDNVPYNKCIMDDLFYIENNVIYFNDHLELDYDWNFVLHTPLCFLAYIKIANINDTRNEILKKFEKFKFDVSIVQGNMWKKCYNCIMNSYPIDKNERIK